MNTRLITRENSYYHCVLVFILFLPALLFAAEVKTGITLKSDQRSIYLGDSIIIEVESVGLVEPLDVTPLFRDAELLRETTGTRIAVINDRVVEVKLRHMELVPRNVGTAFFGPLQGEHKNGTAHSNSLVVSVLPAADTNWQPTAEDHKLQITLSNKAPFVGQRVTLDIKLKHRYPITDESLSLPEFSGFDALPVYESRRTIEEGTKGSTSGPDHSASWRVIAWRYLLFPQRSRELSIGSVSWGGTMIRSRTQRGEFALNETLPNLQVQTAGNDDSWWLPATNVSLSDEWSSDVRELSAGDEVIRTITVTAGDVLANHLPVIEPLPSRAISSTLIKQSREHKIINDVVIATARFDFRMTAQSPIPVFLDTVRVPWWSTLSNEAKEAIIPARRINVGLPDRADLLADVALADEPLARVLLMLRSSGTGWSIWYWALGLLCIASLWVFIREIRWHWSLLRTRKNARDSGRESSVFTDL